MSSLNRDKLIGHFEELLDDGFIVFYPDYKFLVIIKGYFPTPPYFCPITVIEFSINSIR